MPKRYIQTPHRFALNVPEELYRQIEQAAEYDGISQNALIRRAITFYLSKGREL